MSKKSLTYVGIAKAKIRKQEALKQSLRFAIELVASVCIVSALIVVLHYLAI